MTSGTQTRNSATSGSARGGRKDRRLGQGLAALLGTPVDENGNPIDVIPNDGATASNAALRAADPSVQSLELPVDAIEPNPFQPRREFNHEEIASLAESLKNHQQLQPVLVRLVDGKYQLISGERRLRATIHAGLKTIRAELREADDRLVAELAIIENLQRKDLNAIEKALSFK
ncbi:MAG: ParB/RepB/Spo0J family partition protein, partial [Planctomycetota bacterium]